MKQYKGNCKCGTSYILEDYHIQQRHGQELDLCHKCYRQQHKKDLGFLTPFVFVVDEKWGFNPYRPTCAIAQRGDVGVIQDVPKRTPTGKYLCVCGGFYFWCDRDEIAPVHDNALKHSRMLKDITPGEMILNRLQKEMESEEWKEWEKSWNKDKTE